MGYCDPDGVEPRGECPKVKDGDTPPGLEEVREVETRGGEGGVMEDVLGGQGFGVESQERDEFLKLLRR